MASTLFLAAAAFAAIAIYAPRVFEAFCLRNRVRRPHPYLLLIFRIWFGALAVATFLLLLRAPRNP